MKQPFFSRFLETQKLTRTDQKNLTGGDGSAETTKNADVDITDKWPSDSEDCDNPYTEKWPSDCEEE